MPRIPREGFDTSFFHIMVQGINKEYIFQKEEYIKRYLYLMEKYEKDFKIEILAYCIMNNHAHLLVFTEKIEEMAKFMHKINGIYAQHYNKEEKRVGVAFRNRYKSEPIYNEKYLLNCINYIHMNPVHAGIVNNCKDYKYSTCVDYINNIGASQKQILLETVGKINYDAMFSSESLENFIDIDNNITTILERNLEKYLEIADRDLDEILDNNVSLYKLVEYLKTIRGVRDKEIERFLNLSNGKICYLKNALKKRPVPKI